MPLHQYYIDRQFDRFPLHDGIVRPVADGKGELRHDWLSGSADATFGVKQLSVRDTTPIVVP